MHVRFNRLDRQPQFGGNLPISCTFRDETHDGAFPFAQQRQGRCYIALPGVDAQRCSALKTRAPSAAPRIASTSAVVSSLLVTNAAALLPCSHQVDIPIERCQQHRRAWRLRDDAASEVDPALVA